MKKKIGRNDPCPCGSGQKYKYCCISQEQRNRKVQTNIHCESCGNLLEADLSDDMMNKLASSELPLKNFCKDNNFYFFGLIRLNKVNEFHEKLTSGILNKNDFIDAYKNIVDKTSVISWIEDACTLHSAFSKRRQIIIDACEAHFSGKYTLSVPVLFSQIEGILRDIGGLELKDNFKPTIPKEIWNERFLFSLTDSAEYFNAFITKMYEGQQNENAFNRNPILHGMNVSYDSEEWSLILVLTILEIRTFLWFEKNTHSLIKKSI